MTREILRVYTSFLVVALTMAASAAVAGDIELSDLWPNADATEWTYHQTYVPAPWHVGDAIDNSVRFVFRGTTIVPGGIEAQNLELDAPLSAATALGAAPGGLSPLLRHVWLARTDLRGALEEHARRSATGGWSADYNLILLSEAAYVQNEIEIAAYRNDVADLRSWKWLDADIATGSTFTLQLIPDLTDNVWLNGSVAGWEVIDVPSGNTELSLRVDYSIDYGTNACMDFSGEVTGEARSETIGYIHFRPGVGPVMVSEDFIPVAELIWGACGGGSDHIGESAAHAQLLLDSPTPVRSSTWGQVKAMYRE